MLPHCKTLKQNRKNLFSFSGQIHDENEQYGTGYEGIFPCYIVNCWSPFEELEQLLFSGRCSLCPSYNQEVGRTRRIRVVRMRHGELQQLCFVLLFLLLSPQQSLDRDNFQKVKVYEKCGGGRTTIITVVLYFFLPWDAPRSPSVLTGSGGLLCAGRADVNQAWRTSAAGTNNPTSRHPFFHPNFPPSN